MAEAHSVTPSSSRTCLRIVETFLEALVLLTTFYFRPIAVNRASLSIFGFSRDEILKKDIISVLIHLNPLISRQIATNQGGLVSEVP